MDTENEAAERLRSGYYGFDGPLMELVDDALVTERRLTVEPYLREVQRLCPDCTSPELAGTRNGYSCDRHRRLYLSTIGTGEEANR